MGRRFSRITVSMVVLAAAVGCNLRDPDVPPITGPAELSTSLTITAIPDILPEDGASQSIITVFARDTSGNPIPNLALRIDTFVFDLTAPENMRIVDIGTLSARNIVTNSSGRATVTFTAPLGTPGLDSGTQVSFSITPINGDFKSNAPRFVNIRLVPPTVVTVPGAPIPSFTFSPTSPTVGFLVLFDASASFDPDGVIVSYEWDWGDGDVHGFGKNQDHDFLAAGTYFVRLIVTDNSGLKSSLVKPIVVQ